MKLVTYNLYPFVIEALKQADHQVIQTSKSQKLLHLLGKYKPDAVIVFGWDKHSLSALNNESVIFPNIKQKALLERKAATRQLHTLSRIDNRYTQYIGYLSKAFEEYAGWVNSSKDSGITRWVVKVGNEHQGKEKYLVHYEELSIAFLERMSRPDKPVLIEPYVEGRSIRALVLGTKVYLIEQVNDYWIKNLQPHSEEVLPHDSLELLVEDAKHISSTLGLDIVGIDYQISSKDPRDILPLEINIMPGIPDLVKDEQLLYEIKQAYSNTFVELLNKKAKLI